jgi:hypothetical protein
MRPFVVAAVFAVSLWGAAPARASEASAPVGPESKTEKCEHGVKKTLCVRCNPKLIPVFKSKGDWCGEHGVPESQCAKCNPKLAKEGVK